MTGQDKKITRTARVHAKVAEGMSQIEAEIAIVQEDAAKRIAQLKVKQQREEAKIRTHVLDLLENEHPDIYAELFEKAKVKLSGSSGSAGGGSNQPKNEEVPMAPAPVSPQQFGE